VRLLETDEWDCRRDPMTAAAPVHDVAADACARLTDIHNGWTITDMCARDADARPIADTRQHLAGWAVGLQPSGSTGVQTKQR
jgi:hypothetical protein